MRRAWLGGLVVAMATAGVARPASADVITVFADVPEQTFVGTFSWDVLLAADSAVDDLWLTNVWCPVESWCHAPTVAGVLQNARVIVTPAVLDPSDPSVPDPNDPLNQTAFDLSFGESYQWPAIPDVPLEAVALLFTLAFDGATIDFAANLTAPGISTFYVAPRPVSSVPEPTTLLLMGMGAAGVVVRRRTRV